eukprot:scaffold984_cov175-Alexandrium_tamarense.AAC.1
MACLADHSEGIRSSVWSNTVAKIRGEGNEMRLRSGNTENNKYQRPASSVLRLAFLLASKQQTRAHDMRHGHNSSPLES